MLRVSSSQYRCNVEEQTMRCCNRGAKPRLLVTLFERGCVGVRTSPQLSAALLQHLALLATLFFC
jgi:hypothetical protein